MAKKTRTSISTQMEQAVRLNEYAVVIMNALNDAVVSNESKIQVNVPTTDGGSTVLEVPTLGYLKSELDRIDYNQRVLSGLEGGGAVIRTANEQFQRVIAADLNLEPNDITSVSPVNSFSTKKNWFFDSLLNPQLLVEVDLSGRIQTNTRKVMSRRFIVEFERDADTGVLTTQAQARVAEFNRDYKGKSDIDIVGFVQWLSQPGLLNRTDPTLDEQVFDLEPSRLQYQGTFSVLETEEDTLNRKFWYVLDSLTYLDVSNPNVAPTQKTLTTGDKVAIISADATAKSTSVYKVVEVSTVTSKIRVRFEQVGKALEPIPVRNAALRIYSPTVTSRKLNISVGFDEYCVVFLKSVNAENHLLAKNWSKGIGFYTSELRLNSATGTTLQDYYVNYVYDYGKALQDLVAKKIPVELGTTPVAPTLNTANFKVVQINAHLTNTADSAKIKNLNNSKNSLNSEIEQLKNSTSAQRRIIQTTNFKSDDEQRNANARLAELTTRLESANKQFESTVSELMTATQNTTNADPKYRVRGFWFIPDAIQTANTQPQEVIQFEYQYRYANKTTGSESPVETLKTTDGVKTKNGAFSAWVPVKSDVRRRTYNADTGTYTWVLDDISDADTPNINQLDIPLSKGEKVEIRVRSISEVGWPESPLVSDWSETLTVEFPDDLSVVLGENDFILQQATQEQALVKFRKDLTSIGFDEHISSSVNISDRYYAHTSQAILSGVTDENGVQLSMFDVIKQLLSRVESLEEQVKRAKGELQVNITKAGQVSLISNESILDFVIELESLSSTANYGTVNNPITPQNARTYKNSITVYNDFVLQVKNIASGSPLGILSNRIYSDTTGQPSTPFSYNTSPQAAWVDLNHNIIVNDFDTIGATVPAYITTQNNNQWIWLQNADTSNTALYSAGGATQNTVPTVSNMLTALRDVGKNVGLRYDFTSNVSWTPVNITTEGNYEGSVSGIDNTGGYMASSIHPQVSAFSAITEAGNEKIKQITSDLNNLIEIPINIYFRYSTCDNFLNASAPYTDPTAAKVAVQAMMNSLAITAITKGAVSVITVKPGTGYSNSTGVATTALTGSGSGLTVDTTTSSGSLTALSPNAGGSGYAVGDIVSIAGGTISGAGRVTTVSSGAVTGLAIVDIDFLITMGLGAGDYVILGSVLGITEINNRALRITAVDASADTITVAYNSTALTGTHTANTGIFQMITDVTTVVSSGSRPIGQVWNSVGRDNEGNAPINSSLFVVNDSLGTINSPVHKKSIRIYMEPEYQTRPFQCTINFTLRQYKNTQQVFNTNNAPTTTFIRSA